MGYMTLVVIAIGLFMLAGSIHGAEASNGMDFGDGLALFLGIGITVLGTLACIGRYARRLSANQY